MAIPMPLAALIGREGGQNGFSFRDSFGGENFSHKLSCNAVQLCHQSKKSGKIWFVNVYWWMENYFLVLRIYLAEFVSKRGGKYKILFIFA